MSYLIGVPDPADAQLAQADEKAARDQERARLAEMFADEFAGPMLGLPFYLSEPEVKLADQLEECAGADIQATQEAFRVVIEASRAGNARAIALIKRLAKQHGAALAAKERL